MKRKNQTKLFEAIEFFLYSFKLNNFFYKIEIRDAWNQLTKNHLIISTSQIQIKKNKVIIFLNSMLVTVDCNYKKNKIKIAINKKLKKFQILELEFKFKIMTNY